ncbi:MAG: CoA transferase [Acidaminococcaceae bacterium]|nr:CoA transferase [Acidaminococcaceae bacterium]MBO5605128.1 CoA transferase [Acidaminococcaceae bacterium]MBQ7416960.1 CoA transferase [Acidaminococcaceae bacterium]MBQ8491725.1 CoA transferase [Acidaminococcaceae bacterium]MBQ9256856.1 CoA transferase [Acidaminococcaceae bacterium]
MGPLQDIRVLDMSRLLPGPFCTRLFADMGADVIKIEEPVKGDYSRDFVPRRGDFACWFMEVNRNKKSVALDLKKEEDRRLFLELAKTAQVVVESYRPGVMKKLGVDFETVKQVNPKIVYCSITGYGKQGPLVKQADHDIGYQSLAGLISLSGEKDGKPSIPGVLAADMQASAMAGMSILAALHHAEQTGEGQEISLSLFDTCLALVPGVSATYFGNGFVNMRGNNWLSGANPNYNVYRTKDGRYMSVGCLEEKFWKNLCGVLERPDLIPVIQDETKYPWLKDELTAIIATKTMEEWVELAKGSDSCFAPVLNYDEALATGQAMADEMVLDVEDPELGNYKTMGFVTKFSATPCQLYRRAPRLGEHTEEILGEIAEPEQKHQQ